MEPRAGSIFGQKFVIERPLARGGMGSVWAGRHLSLDVPIAIKLMEQSIAASLPARARFEREARAAAQLRSPHVVQILDYGVDDGTPYMVLELLTGEDLRTRLERLKRLSLDETATIVSQIARGLALAHDAGIVHRDIKPSNVFLARIGEDEVVKLLDFGVAKEMNARVVDDATATGQLLGSPAYMSPEQARGAALDHRSDLWSLAVVVFHALTGHRPFSGDHAGDIIAKICSDELPIATRFAPDLPAAVDTFFARALCRSPDGRFASARAMAEELGRLAGQETRSPGAPLAPLPVRTPGDAPLAARDDETVSQAPIVTNRPEPVTGRTAPGELATPTDTAPTLPPTRRWRRLGWIAVPATLGALWLAWQAQLVRAPGAAADADPVAASTTTSALPAPSAQAPPAATITPFVIPESSAAASSAPAASVAPTAPRGFVPPRRPPRPPPAHPTSGPAPRVDPKFGLPVAPGSP